MTFISRWAQAAALSWALVASTALAAEIEAKPVELAPSEAAKLAPLQFRGGVRLSSPDKAFRGFSGIWVSDDGRRLVAVEGGEWTTADLVYDAKGDLAGLKVTSVAPLLDTAGQPLAAEADKDAEAVDRHDGRLIVGFETNNRVAAYRSPTAKAEPIALPPEALKGVAGGAGFSSVASLPGDRLLVLPEYTAEEGETPEYHAHRTRGWLITPKGAGSVWLRAGDRWLPVSLAALPNGDVILLELFLPRTPGPITDTRISRIRAADIAIGATLPAQTLATFAPPVPGSRLEGASVRKGTKGETLLYLMSNMDPAVLYMFELPPGD